MVHKQIRGQPEFMSRFGAGQSTYHESNAYGGIVMPQEKFADAPEVFQMWSTRLGIA